MGKSVFKEIGSALIDFSEFLLIGVSVFIIVYLFVGQLLEVSGDSMYPTFKDKEQIIAEKVSINMNELSRGEIIIFKSPKEPEKLLIKRVIALPGETIMINEGSVYINGEILNEEYLVPTVQTEGGMVIREGVEYKIDQDAYVLMGDNRKQSTDSREYGAVDTELIVGRGIIVYYPFSEFRLVSD